MTTPPIPFLAQDVSRADRDALASAYLPRVRVMAREFARHRGGHRVGVDELESVGHLALAEALATWNPAVDPSFEPIFRTVLRRAMIDERRRATPLGYRGDANRTGLATHPEIGVIEADPVDDAPPADHAEFEAWVESLASRLPARHAELIRLHYLDARCRKLGDCARMLGISQPRSSQIHSEAVAMIRVRLVATNYPI